MSLVLADQGAGLMLNMILNASPATMSTKLHLFCNNLTPTHNSSIASFTEAQDGGYAVIPLPKGSWATSGDPKEAAYAQQTFTFTGPLTTNGTIYGYYMTNYDSSILLWAELFGSTFTPANNGDQLKVTPKLQLSKGTPS